LVPNIHACADVFATESSEERECVVGKKVSRGEERVQQVAAEKHLLLAVTSDFPGVPLVKSLDDDQNASFDLWGLLSNQLGSGCIESHSEHGYKTTLIELLRTQLVLSNALCR
jgi:hypothetical protein